MIKTLVGFGLCGVLCVGCSALGVNGVEIDPADVAAGVECAGQVQKVVEVAKAQKSELNACVDLVKSIEAKAK